jgi:hypothetical protein
MSSKNIVNPDHYKIGGRDKPNEHMPAGKRPLGRDEERNQERWREHEKERKEHDERREQND